jgi:hypothetical protein
MSRITIIRISGIVIAGLCAVSIGQVRQAGSSGRALDRSYQVGSGGYNTRIPQNYAPLGNTHISGITESRGLSAFMGRAPTLTSELTVGARTNGLSRFRRQAVSMSDVSSGAGLYDPQRTTYVDPLRATITVHDVVGASRDYQMPTRGGTRSPGTSQQAKKLFVDATAGYKPLMTQDARLGPLGETLTVRPEMYDAQKSDQLIRTVDSMDIAHRGGDELFGILRREDRAKLAEEINEFQDEDTPKEDRSLDASVDARAYQPIEPKPIGAERDLADRLAGPGVEKPSLGLEKKSDRDDPRRMDLRDETTGLPAEDQDVFLDLLLTLREKTQAQERAQKKEPPPGLQDIEEEDELYPPKRVRRTRTDRSGRRLVEQDKNNRIIIRGLAGKSGDMFNRYMTRAKRDMKAGRFYSASRQYELASINSPRNPLARLGSSLSTFAAGEWYTSAGELRRAMELFPPLMETKLDISSMMSEEIFRKRLDDLETWIATINKEPLLLFLAAFMQNNAGNEAGARRHAEELRKSDEADDLIKAYAEYVLTGKRPAEQKTPAKK